MAGSDDVAGRSIQEAEECRVSGTGNGGGSCRSAQWQWISVGSAALGLQRIEVEMSAVAGWEPVWTGQHSTATLGVNLSCAAQCPHLGLGTYLADVEWWGRVNLGRPHVMAPAC